jgi:hypothetical protein
VKLRKTKASKPSKSRRSKKSWPIFSKWRHKCNRCKAKLSKIKTTPTLSTISSPKDLGNLMIRVFLASLMTTEPEILIDQFSDHLQDSIILSFDKLRTRQALITYSAISLSFFSFLSSQSRTKILLCRIIFDVFCYFEKYLILIIEFIYPTPSNQNQRDFCSNIN